jgi:hypothetical protein
LTSESRCDRKEKRKLQIEELRNLCSAPNIIRTIKSRRMKWEGNILRIVEIRNAYKILVEKHKGEKPL